MGSSECHYVTSSPGTPQLCPQKNNLSPLYCLMRGNYLPPIFPQLHMVLVPKIENCVVNHGNNRPTRTSAMVPRIFPPLPSRPREDRSQSCLRPDVAVVDRDIARIVPPSIIRRGRVVVRVEILAPESRRRRRRHRRTDVEGRLHEGRRRLPVPYHELRTQDVRRPRAVQ